MAHEEKEIAELTDTDVNAVADSLEAEAAVSPYQEWIDKVQGMLNEEKFTRAALSSYSVNQFNELDALLKEIEAAGALSAVKDACDEHLAHTKNSIIALYLSGMAGLSRQIINDAALVTLVNIFVDNHKPNIVKHLCERILEYGESKFALRTLGDIYRADKKDDAMYEVWERLVKVDYEETEIVKLLGDRAEKEGDLDAAVDYYRKALHRCINRKVFTNIKEIWQKLLEYRGEDIDFFLSIQKRVAKNFSGEKAAALLKDLYAHVMKKTSTSSDDTSSDDVTSSYDVTTGITILKMILDYDEKDAEARTEITECFRKKYASHSQVEDFIRVSNLTQGWRNVHEAISDFEKHIAFDKGNFVYHRTWGVGRIASTTGDDITIDFAKKRGHTMSLKMAIDALQTLSKNHIWVLKATWQREKLHDKVKNEPEWALKTVIKSFNNALDLKHIKAELVPQVLSAGEWTSWSNKIKDILATNPAFGVSPQNINTFTVRDRPISVNEKLFNEFKAETKFFNRVEILSKFVSREDEPVELDSDYFTEMYGYFTAYLKPYFQKDDDDEAKTTSPVSEMALSSYLLVKWLAGKYSALSSEPPLSTAGSNLNFVTLFEGLENVTETFTKIKNAEIRRDFLRQIKLFCPDWASIYVKLFPHAQLDMILHSLLEGGFDDKLVELTARCFDNYRDRESRDTAVWLYKNYRDAPWFKRTALSEEKILITFIYILDTTWREIDNHRDTSENRRTNKTVASFLFGEGMLISYLDKALAADDKTTVSRMCTLIDDLKGIDPAVKMDIHHRAGQKYPEFKHAAGAAKELVSRGLIVTQAKYEEKQRQLAHILDEEVPANSKEIAFALSLGDLRENAEYKAAKEKQEILNSTVAKLKDEIERSQLFDPRQINTSHISFGTIATLRNETRQAGETYTILGPWESDPDRNIISYLSPFGSAMYGKRAGESFAFVRAGEKMQFTVEKIDAAVI